LLEVIKMQVRIRETGQVMYEGEFRALFPNTSMPQQLSEALINELGADVVFEGAQATGGTVYQYSQASGVEQVNGKWYTKYILGPVFADTAATETEPARTAAENEASYKATKDAEQAKSVRATRDSKLAECDWRVIKAAETSTTLDPAWATYRQALRDVTGQSGFPWTIDWPVAP
jgi:hypothetical protein